MRLRSGETPDAVNWATCTRLNYEMDGTQFIKRIRQSPRLDTMPVIVITGHVNEETHDKSLRAGAGFVLEKPPESKK